MKKFSKNRKSESGTGGFESRKITKKRKEDKCDEKEAGVFCDNENIVVQ
jgi:hypothetical protein